MPFLSTAQIERIKTNAKVAGMKEVLSMEVVHITDRRFVYSEDIRELIRRTQKSRQV